MHSIMSNISQATVQTKNTACVHHILPCQWSQSIQQRLLTCALVLSRNVENAIGVDLKGDLYLRDAAGGRRDACQVELAQQVVILGHGPLTLVHLQGMQTFVC